MSNHRRLQPRRVDPAWSAAASAVFDDLLATAGSCGYETFVAAALRTRTFAARHVLVRAATRGTLDYADLLHCLRAGSAGGQELSGVLDWDPAVALARVVALQRLEPDDEVVGARLLTILHDDFGLAGFKPAVLHLYAQLLYAAGEYDRLRTLLPALRNVPESLLRCVRLDLLNPFNGAGTAVGAWLALCGEILRADGVEPVELAVDGPTPFDRLRCRLDAGSAGGPLVTVIITTHRPDAGLLTAVRSVVEQTWRDLEILVIDDGSPVECSEILDACVAMDDRIALHRQEVNAGTYVARNLGLGSARGEFVTFQDSDDWSHPRRIERQLAPLLADDELFASRSRLIRVHDDLTCNLPGVEPFRVNPSSLLFRRRPVMNRIGYFDSVRKGADSEHAGRLEVAHPGCTADLPQLLAFVRLGPGSLSRHDFARGWRHEARRDYRTVFEHWHRRLGALGESPYLAKRPHSRPFVAPAAFVRDLPAVSSRARHFDVVLANHHRAEPAAQWSLIRQIQALMRRGCRVGLAELEDLRLAASGPPALGPQLLDLVLSGDVDLVQLDQGARVDLLVVGDAPVLQVAPSMPTDLDVGRVAIVAGLMPGAVDAPRAPYAVDTCEQSVQDLFGVDPVWLPRTPRVRQALALVVKRERLSPVDLPEIMDLDLWTPRRPEGRSGRAVVGLRSCADPATFHSHPHAPAANRDSGELDLRVMGGVGDRVWLSRRRADGSPWIDGPFDEDFVRYLLAEIDFYVDLDADRSADIGPGIVLDALCAGCVPVLEPGARAIFADAVLYAEAPSWTDNVRELWKDPRGYRDQVAEGWAFVRRHFGYDRYADVVTGLLPGGHAARLEFEHTPQPEPDFRGSDDPPGPGRRRTLR